MMHLALRHAFEVAADPGWLGAFLDDVLVHLRGSTGGGHVHRYTATLDDSGSTPRLRIGIASRESAPAAPTPAIAQLITAVNVAAVASVPEHPVLHASAVSVDGRCILVPGRPGQGKSTLAAGLVGEGCGYLTDEAVPIDAEGRAWPYPKPVVVGPGSWPSLVHLEGARVRCDRLRLEAWHLDPARIGAVIVREPLPVGAVVVPRYRPGSPTSIRPISSAEATAAMCSNTFNLSVHGGAGVARCAEVAMAAQCVELVHGDLRAACRQLLDGLGL